MNEFVLNARNVENKEWVALILVLSLLFLVLTKTAFENKFIDFRNLIFSEKYIKTYRDSSHLMTWFTFLLFVVQILAFSFFIHFLIYYYGFFEISSKADWILYVRVVTFFTFFVLSKYLIEKIVSTAFDIEEFAEQYNMIKVSYRNFIAFLLLPTTMILFYNNKVLPIVVEILLYILLAFNAIIYIKCFKFFRKIITSKLLYFILYLCTLEIAPYYFMYYWFTKK